MFEHESKYYSELKTIGHIAMNCKSSRTGSILVAKVQQQKATWNLQAGKKGLLVNLRARHKHVQVNSMSAGNLQDAQ